MTTSYISKGSFLLCLFLFTGMLYAQENFIAYWDAQIGLNHKVAAGYSQNFSVMDRSFIYNSEELQLKVRNLDLSHLSNFRLKDRQSISFGLLYRFRHNFDENKNDELRFTEQYLINHGTKRLQYWHRLQSEQRLMQSFTVHRFRYRLELAYPLQGESLEIGETYLLGSSESFLSIANSSVPKYDQNIKCTLGWFLMNNAKLQTGLEYRFQDYTHLKNQSCFISTALLLTI